MNGLDERAVGAPAAPSKPQPLGQQMTDERPLYTRYCAAAGPTHPIGEPRIIHSLLVAMWLGRLVDVLPHAHRES